MLEGKMSEQDTKERQIEWVKTRLVPVDHGGPVNIPFTQVEVRDGPMGLDLFESAAARFPNKVAVFDGKISLTYSELLDRVYGVAKQIIDSVPPGGVVVSIINSGSVAPVVMLGVIASGRTLIPIDAGHPIERQTALFAEAHASAVVLAEGVEIDDSFIPASMPRITVDVTKASGAGRVGEARQPGMPLMVGFTSGSTGRPKGLAFGGGSNGKSLQAFMQRSHANERDVFVSLASMSQVGGADIMAFIAGATLRIIDMKRVGLIDTLRIMGEEGITVLSFVPSVLRTFMAMPGIEKSFASLRLLDLHGERILASDIALFRSKLPKDCCISVTYGSTEAGGVFSWFVQDDKIEGSVVPLGYLVRNKQVAIVDENGRQVPVGQIGDLLVRGEMAMGSWQGGRVTKARFLSDPEDPSVMIYPMGDQVRMRTDGLFEFIGRRDRQVKIRGLWVDLGEIESALRAAEGVVEAVVVARSVKGGADTLAAFITLDESMPAPQAAALRRAVVAATAEHMAPAEIRVLAEIPRLANYKPDLVRLDAMLSGPGERLA
jgi:acyl-coenzyme A synthetase/AMP-(fatty) acid ligase